MSSDYAHKLRAFEAQPPAEAWSRIADTLEGSAATTASDKLFFYEQLPPAGVWEKIEAALPEAKTKVVPLFGRYRRPIRYASATAALVLIGLLTSLLLSKRTESGPVAGNPVHQASQAPANTPQSETQATSAVPEAPAADRLNPNSTSGPATIAYRSVTGTPSVDRLSYLNTTDVTEGLRRAVRSSMLFRRLFSVPDEPRAIPPLDGADRYMVYRNGDGNLTRLSKRMYDDIHCQDDDLACLQRIRSLQQKLSSSALTADFNGVMQILGDLQENK